MKFSDLPPKTEADLDGTEVVPLDWDLAGTPETVRVLLSDLAEHIAPPASDTVAGLIEIATEAEVAGNVSNDLAVTPGRMRYHPLAVKGWVQFNASSGAPSVTDGYNLDSVTDMGTGNFQVNWNTDFLAGGNCSVVASAGLSGNRYVADLGGSGTMLAGSTRIITASLSGTLTDVSVCCVIACGV